VTATSAAERPTLLRFGAEPSNVTVIPCGVDLQRFQPAALRRRDRRSRPRVVCVSRLVPRKGIADVIEAIAEIPGVELLIAGGPQAAMLDDDPYAVELAALVDELGVTDRVQLLGGIEPDRVPALLQSADAVCCTPWYEPFGMVAVEAMACGTPVVATAVGGLAETVLDGRTGLQVPPRRPDRIRDAITSILGDRRLAAAMRAASTSRAAAYGWPRVSAATLRVLSAMAGRQAAAVTSPAVAGGWIRGGR
jgi:glycosyltransferase involved in cell wall biosynthesis